MAFLMSLIAIGYILMHFRLVPDNSEKVLSRLENYLFIPALVLATFMNHFTVSKISSAWKLLLGSLLAEAIVVPLALLGSRLCAKNRYERNIYLYGLCFSNFGFMGNAIVSVLFPDIFLEYMIFTLVLWILIYLWGVPSLLMNRQDAKRNLKEKLKPLLNPMLVCMIIGMILGISQIRTPSFIGSLVSSAGNCMSPVAMLLTGMTIAKIDLPSVLKNKSIYFITFLRLLVFPLLFLVAFLFLKEHVSNTFIICTVCSLAMPLGLNTIVIPGAYGKDTSIASGMALISHILSCLTIPFIFLLLNQILSH